MYKIDTKVRYSECGEDGTLKLAALLNYFQDSSSAHSESLGVGMDYLKEKRCVWILNSWQVVIERLPKVHEAIEITTWPTGFKGVFGPRNFCMKTQDGEMLAYANTLWVHMDLDKQRPIKPDEEQMAIYGIEPPLEMEYAPRKIKLPDDAVVVDTFSVRKYHIDTNSHVNNAQYVQMALEAVPDAFQIREVRVEYKKSAVYGDTIVVKKAVEEDRIVVELCSLKDEVYATVELLPKQA
ncbi:MAG: acyl-[Tyzzerella sp.]|nr:acyl-[acyl-carrier-protein] thioesterase [Tyzzerella sp.]